MSGVRMPKFGTGAEAPPRPPLLRIVFEGAALATGWVIVFGTVKLLKRAWGDSEIPEDIEELRERVRRKRALEGEE
jgi:hypothetical protein